MPDTQTQNPDTLPADFFAAPGSGTSNPDTLPSDFFTGNTKGNPSNWPNTGSQSVDDFIRHITTQSPLNPGNWGQMISHVFESPFSDDKVALADSILQDMDNGKPHEALKKLFPGVTSPGAVAGDLANQALMAGLTIGAIKGGSALVDKLGEPNFATTATKVWKPTPNDSDFADVVPEALADTKKYGQPGSQPSVSTGNQPWRNSDLLPTKLNGDSATDSTINVLQGAMDKWVNRAEQAGVKISGDPIVQRIKDSIPAKMWQEDPQYAQQLVDKAQVAYGGKQFTPSQFRDFLRTGNASDSPFFNKSQAGQGTSITAGNAPAIEAASTQAIRDQLYNALDPQGSGAGPREIQERTGNVINLRDAAERRRNAIAAEKPDTIAEGITRAVTLGLADKLKGAFGFGPASSGLHPFLGPSDARVSKLFDYAPDAKPIPLPESNYYTTGGNRLPSPAIEVPEERLLSAPASVPEGYKPGNVTPGNPQITVQTPSGRVINLEGGLYNGLTRRNLEPETDAQKLLTSRDPNNPAPTVVPGNPQQPYMTPPPDSRWNDFGRIVQGPEHSSEIVPEGYIQIPQDREILATGKSPVPAKGPDGKFIGGKSQVISPRGEEPANTNTYVMENPQQPSGLNVYPNGYNPDVIARMKFGQSYSRLDVPSRALVDDIVSGKRTLKLSDFANRVR